MMLTFFEQMVLMFILKFNFHIIVFILKAFLLKQILYFPYNFSIKALKNTSDLYPTHCF